jgi:hypothetical protein
MANQVLYGFYNLKDLATQRAATVETRVINDAIDASLEEHNRQLDALLDLFAFRTTDYTARFNQIGAKRLQPLDEHGRPRPTKAGGYYDVAFPIQMAGDALGQTFVARAKMTVQEVNNAIASMIVADKRWMRDHILSALFASATWSFVDPLKGTLTVQPLANGDTVSYQIMDGADAGAADTHQLAQAAAIADATNPYPVIRTELLEHPENGGDVIAFIPTGLRATTEALATFVPVSDANIRQGANTDVLVGTLGARVPGTLIGYVEGVWIVEWPALPANYIVGTTTEGQRPLAMREDPEPELQGFKRVAERNDHPYYESIYQRRAGFGAWNRVGALVYRIGNGTYAVPTNYTPPIA